MKQNKKTTGCLQCKDCRHCHCVHAQLCLTLYDHLDSSPPGSSVHGILSGKNTGAGCYFLLQRIFPIQGLNLHLLHLLHCQADSLPLSCWEGPIGTFIVIEKTKCHPAKGYKKGFPETVMYPGTCICSQHAPYWSQYFS